MPCALFVLKGDPAVKFMPKAVEIFEGDLCNAEDCEKFFAVEPGVQTVCIHCASMVTINPNYSEKLIAVNVGGTENMLNAAKNHPECKKFVYVSSTGAIPELPKGESIREVYSFVPYDDDRVVGWYSRSKAMATQKVLDAAAAKPIAGSFLTLSTCSVQGMGRTGRSDCPSEPLAGGHRQSAWRRACQGLPHRGRRQQDAAAAGRGRYGLFCHSRLPSEPCARSTAAAR